MRNHLSMSLSLNNCAGKLNDMSSVTHRAIVSSSGFSAATKSKAEHHGIDLYTLEKWATPIQFYFPRFGLKGVPEEQQFPSPFRFFSG